MERDPILHTFWDADGNPKTSLPPLARLQPNALPDALIAKYSSDVKTLHLPEVAGGPATTGRHATADEGALPPHQQQPFAEGTSEAGEVSKPLGPGPSMTPWGYVNGESGGLIRQASAIQFTDDGRSNARVGSANTPAKMLSRQMTMRAVKAVHLGGKELSRRRGGLRA